MELIVIFVTVLLQVHSTVSDRGQTTVVYGFEGATNTVASGRTLHYTVNLDKCQLTSSPDDPELVQPFGGHTTTWRMFNDREVSSIPFIMLNEMKMVYDNSDRLVQLSRQMQIWSNDTVDVTSIVYTLDLSTVTSMYTHTCTMMAEGKKGDIELMATLAEPDRLHSFENITEALESGFGLHFNVMSFLCQGGKEHTFSSFGGHIPNYELSMEGDKISIIHISVQQVVHFDIKSGNNVVDVINMDIFNNRTVHVIDSRGKAPYMDPIHKHVSSCFLELGQPGGTVTVFV